MPDSESIADDVIPPTRGRRKWKRWLVLAVLVGGLVWLNGPGIRWLGPKVAEHFLSKAGYRGTFELEGRFIGGLSLRNLELESDKALARLKVDRLRPDYRLGGLLNGRLDGIEVDGVHADLRLGVAGAARPEKEKAEPLDLEALVKSLRSLRGRIIPVELDFRNLSLDITRDGGRVISLGKSRIVHKAGEPEIEVELGALTDASGKEWSAQDVAIVWQEDDLTIARFDPLPGLGLRELVLRLPAGGGPLAEAELHLDGAVFVVNATPGFSSVLVNLREGSLMSEVVAERFNLELPASGELSSFSADIENLFPDPKRATGSAQLLVEDMVYQDWRVPELSLDVALETGRGTIAARGVALGTEFSVNAEAALDRKGGDFLPGETRGEFSVAEVSKLVAGLSERVGGIDGEAPVPASMVEGDFRVSFSNKQPDSAEVSLAVKPVEADAAAEMAITLGWRAAGPVSMGLELEGVTASAELDLEKAGYQVLMEFDEFKSTRIDPWLGIGKVASPGQLSLTGTWRGSGELRENRHRGSFTLAGAELVREGMPPVHAEGGIEYDWPGGFTTRGLRMTAAGQSVAGDLKMAEGFLEMAELRWEDGGTTVAAGSAKLPVPEDFSKWRDTLADDARPLEVSLQSERLALRRLKDWVPAAEAINPEATGKVELSVSGTYAEPVVHALVEVKELRAPGRPEVSPASLKLTLDALDGRIAVEGSATAGDLPPAAMSASMAFRPGEWAERPGLVMEEDISARADLPRVDLGRFAALVPGVRTLAGGLSGNVDVAGKIGKPEIRGSVDLTEVGFDFGKPGLPAVSALGASVDLTLGRITLKELKANVAGGTLQGAGSLALEGGKPAGLDFRLKGKHLPLRRDESLILRANADLRLSGTWEQAALTGTLGVVDSIFYRDIELLPIGSPFTMPSAAALPKIDAAVKPTESVPEPFRDWTIDVRVRSENPFLIRGNLATGKATARVRIGGTIGSPAPDGEVLISDFRATLPFSTLTVRRGTLRFTPANGFDPVLEIRGSAEPRPYNVNVFVYGSASDPQLVLTSSPPLPENEIMTLLATGTTTAGLEDPQAASSRALQLFAEELRRGRFAVGRQLRPLLGLLDRVDFSLAEADPYSSESFSTATLEITDRWFLSAGMGSEGDSRVLAIWRLRFY